LLARGVLAGADRSGDMRVFLRAEASPAASLPHNGNGHGSEANAFRELLTEFRNLTERYGQALLALGEARGEVASLRGRVDQLEARVDQRLAGPMASAPFVLADLDEAVAVDDLPEPAAEFVAEAPRPKSRRRTASFEEALARAEDPSPGTLPGSDTISLPGAREAAAALADLRDGGDEPPPSAPPEPAWQPSGPLPAALVEGPYSAAVEEPDWIAEEDLVEQMSAPPEAPSAPEEVVPPEPPPMTVTAAEWVGMEDESDSSAAADEFETTTSTWQTVVPPLPPLFEEGSDPLTQVATDQGWAPEEVEAMRELLAAEAAVAAEVIEPALEFDADEPVVSEPDVVPPKPAPVAPAPRSMPSPAGRSAPPRRSATQRASRRLRRLFGG
jgi:hypothetical protein